MLFKAYAAAAVLEFMEKITEEYPRISGFFGTCADSVYQHR